MTKEPDPLLQQLGAYTLGLIPTEASRQRLTVLTSDAFEASTRAKCRHRTRASGQHGPGYDAFTDLLGATSTDVEHLLATKNALKAIGELADKFDASQRSELARLIKPIAEKAPQAAIKIEAGSTLLLLKGDG